MTVNTVNDNTKALLALIIILSKIVGEHLGNVHILTHTIHKLFGWRSENLSDLRAFLAIALHFWIWRKRMIRVDRDAMWNVLRLNGIGGRLLQGVKSLNVGSKACVRVGNEVSGFQ